MRTWTLNYKFSISRVSESATRAVYIVASKYLIRNVSNPSLNFCDLEIPKSLLWPSIGPSMLLMQAIKRRSSASLAKVAFHNISARSITQKAKTSLFAWTKTALMTAAVPLATRAAQNASSTLPPAYHVRRSLLSLKGVAQLDRVLPKSIDAVKILLDSGPHVQVTPISIQKKPGDSTVQAKPRCYPPQKQEFMQAYTKKLQKMEFVKVAVQPKWMAAPPVVPKKPISILMLTMEYRPVNYATVRYKHTPVLNFLFKSFLFFIKFIFIWRYKICVAVQRTKRVMKQRFLSYATVLNM